MTELEKTIGHEFRDVALLNTALTSPACRMEHPEVEDNQRLEFLGDAVFGLLSADAIFAANVSEREGALTVRRAHLVSGAALAAAAERVGLRKFLRRNSGAGELPPCAKPLADAMEAVMGAVWLDGGIDAARTVFGRLGLPLGERPDEWRMNPKGALQTFAQSRRPPRHPAYRVVRSEGPAHAPVVTVEASVDGLGAAQATAVSQRAAEIAAAAALLERLHAHPRAGEAGRSNRSADRTNKEEKPWKSSRMG